MNSKTKCMICRSSQHDILNLGEMKTYENVTAHYYCLLLASTIKQSGEDEEGILGFLPSDIQAEVKLSQKRVCFYCKKNGASVLCSTKTCKIMFHLPCGVANNSGHQFHDGFLSNCKMHRPKQKFKKPSEPQKCPICLENVSFKDWTQVLCAPCCKRQTFFHKICIQQMALSAGYFFKCPMCNNCEVFQKAMKHHGVFIPDRDASWELEPNAFEELLYRHTECNAKDCLCKNGREYDNLGPWTIVLCSMCGSQGTHIHCSKLKKNEDWICESCVIEKKTNEENQRNALAVPLFQPSTSHMMDPLDLAQIPNNIDISLTPPQPKKRKRNQSLCSATIETKNYTNLIEIDSEDSDVIMIEDEPNTKCLITQDRSLLKNNNTRENVDTINQDSSSCTDFMNLVITDVRSLSDTKDHFIESDDFKTIQNKEIFSITAVTDEQQQTFYLQEMVYNNISQYQGEHFGNTDSSSSDDIVIID